MTQVDSSAARQLGRPLDSKPTHGSGQVDVSATTPLPPGWASFCSKPDRHSPSHWYATPPYNVTALQKRYGAAARSLLYTVDAKSWAHLHIAVAEQVEMYERITLGAAS